MATDSREARLRQGLRDLDRLGVAAEKASVADLEHALEAAPGAALAIADLLGGLASEESARLLARLEAVAREDKSLRREVRRAVYRLRQKGVVIPEREADEAPPVVSSFAAPEAEGHLSISDPLGDRLLWIIKQRSGGGLFHLTVIVNEPGGLKEAALTEINRKSLRSLRQELEARHGVRLVEVDWRYCDAIAGEAYERARQAGQVSESAALYPQLRLQLIPSAAEPPPLFPPAVVPEPDASSLATSAALFEEPELGLWFLPDAALSPYLARYRELRDSPIVLDRPLQLQRVEEIIATAVEETFSTERARSWQRRLGEAAHFFAKTARPESATRAGSVVAALTEGSGGKGIPFCEELVRRSFRLFFAREAERQREEKASSVLVTPDDIRAEQARAAKSRRR